MDELLGRSGHRIISFKLTCCDLLWYLYFLHWSELFRNDINTRRDTERDNGNFDTFQSRTSQMDLYFWTLGSPSSCIFLQAAPTPYKGSQILNIPLTHGTLISCFSNFPERWWRSIKRRPRGRTFLPSGELSQACPVSTAAFGDLEPIACNIHLWSIEMRWRTP